MSRTARWNTVWTMMAVGLAVRLIVIHFMYLEHLNPILHHWKFGWEMGNVARSLYEGRGFSSPLFEPSGPTAWMAPVYPLIVAGAFKVFGLYTTASCWAVLTLNSIFAVATTWAVYRIAMRLFGDPAAKIAGWVWTFFPYSIYLSGGRIWENTLTTMIVAMIILLTLSLEAEPTTKKWIGWGALWGFGTLVSPAITSVLPFFGLWVGYRHYKRGIKWLPKATVAAIVFWMVMSPWVLRNWMTFHKFIPLRDNFWLEVHVGNNGDTSDVTPDSSHPSNSVIEREQWNRLGELQFMEAKKVESKAFISEHKAFFAWVSVRRFVYVWTGFWSLDPTFLAGEPFHIPNVIFMSSLTFMLLLGLGRAWKRGEGEKTMPFIYLIVFFPAIYYFTHPAMDYRHPLDIAIVVMSSYYIADKYKIRKRAAEQVDLEPVEV